MPSIPHPFRVYAPPIKANESVGSDAERAFSQMDSLYRRLVQYLPEAVYCCDPDGRITLFNRAALRLWGRLPAVGVERWCGSHRLFTPQGDPIAPEDCAMAKTLKSGSDLGSQEVVIERPDGSRRFVLVHPQIVRDGGVVLGAVNVIIDITERKNAENLLREADRRKDEFLAMLAHELRNPLAPVRAAAEVLKRINIADAKATQAVGVIERQVTQLARLIDDLLDVARMGQGQVSLRKSQVPLSEVLSNATDVVMPEVQRRAQTLEVTAPHADVMLLCDLARVAQMIGNLLHNATKYTHTGGHIALTASVFEHRLRICVADDGQGIEPDMLDSVFDLFSRAATGAGADGLGIGLSVVKAMAQLHHGTITAHSAGLGQGSEFVLELPVLAPAAIDIDCPPPVSHGPGRTQRILLVDDNVDSVAALQILLELDGHTVQVAHDGFSALETAGRFSADAFVIDIGLPGMDGYELARSLRRRPASASATIVAMSGWGAPDDVQRAMQAGFDRHLSKPADFAQLIAALQGRYAR